jgi:hypothetical protein
MRRPHRIIVLLLTHAACVVGPTVLGDPGQGESSGAIDPSQGESSGACDSSSSSSSSSSSDPSLGDTGIGDDAPYPGDMLVCDPDDPCAAMPERGRLFMDRCGVPDAVVAHIGVGCEEALSFCRDVGEHGHAVYCTLNDVVIHRAGDTTACDEMYGTASVCDPPRCFDPCEGHGGELGTARALVGCQDTCVLTPEQYEALSLPRTCDEVLAICNAIGDDYPDSSLVCTWNDEVILWRELTPGQCEAAGPEPTPCEDPEG